MPTAKIYYDADADLGLLKGKKVVFVGYGNQGSAQAQNLRDSGITDILVANREDSFADEAKKDGFEVIHSFEEAAKVADVLFLLIPDQVQPRVFNETIGPHLQPHACVVVASGYNVFYGLLELAKSLDVVMVAPRMIGISVRSTFTSGQGFPCFVSVEQDGTGNGHALSLALAKGIGATRAGAIQSSVREETAMDLLAEQALWPMIISCFREAFSVLKEAGCSDEALCYEMWMSKEPAEIFERAAEVGFIEQLRYHSSVSQFGQLRGALNVDAAPIRQFIRTVLHERVLNGAFAKEFQAIEAELEKTGEENPLEKLYAETNKTELAVAEKGVRERLKAHLGVGAAGR